MNLFDFENALFNLFLKFIKVISRYLETFISLISKSSSPPILQRLKKVSIKSSSIFVFSFNNCIKTLSFFDSFCMYIRKLILY
jgi:hypothetical protein